MPPNKPRLYLALYARLKYPDSFHYALHVSPKKEGKSVDCADVWKYPCKNVLQSIDGVVSCPWTLEIVNINSNKDPMLIARILLAKIHTVGHVDAEMRSVPLRQDDPTFDCVEWVRLALYQLQSVGIVVVPDWDEIQKTALAFIQRKKAEGRYDVGWGDTSNIATFDMLRNKETVP